MSMKDAIFGTAAPSSHGSATYRDSIQAWLPVKNIIGGVVITKDNRFIKILEVLPVNFYLKSPSDQQNIITSYAAYLKIAPDSMSCEVRTLPPDTSEYVEQMRQFQKSEESENCRAEIEDNIEKIGLGIASESIRHRFFLVFQYEAKMRAKRNTVKGIIQRLNEEADTARRYLDICELEVLEPRYTDDFVLKLLYELINKGTSLRVKLPEGVFDMTTEVHGVVWRINGKGGADASAPPRCPPQSNTTIPFINSCFSFVCAARSFQLCKITMHRVNLPSFLLLCIDLFYFLQNSVLILFAKAILFFQKISVLLVTQGGEINPRV